MYFSGSATFTVQVTFVTRKAAGSATFSQRNALCIVCGKGAVQNTNSNAQKNVQRFNNSTLAEGDGAAFASVRF